MTQGEIVLIHFPFTNFENSKLRPALVISNTRFNQHANVILLAISTKSGNKAYSEKIIQADLKAGKLLKESYVKFSNIISIEKRLVLKSVAVINQKKLSLIKKKIASFIE